MAESGRSEMGRERLLTTHSGHQSIRTGEPGERVLENDVYDFFVDVVGQLNRLRFFEFM